MGWNNVNCLNGLEKLNGYYYFANSFYVKDKYYEIANCNYSKSFSSIIEYRNILGCQFHPEKSSKNGINFLNFYLDSL
jgi:glutamine amidotransferase